MESNVSVTVQSLFTAGSQCLFTRTSGVDVRDSHTAPWSAPSGLYTSQRTVCLVGAHIHDVFSACCALAKDSPFRIKAGSRLDWSGATATSAPSPP